MVFNSTKQGDFISRL